MHDSLELRNANRSILASVLGLLITTSFPILPVQAQFDAQSCQIQIGIDQLPRATYPIQPLPDTIATNSVTRQLAELSAIAAAPDTMEVYVQNSLDRWLVRRPDDTAGDPTLTPQMEQLLKELTVRSQSSQKAKLIQVLDQVTTRIERIRNPQTKIQLLSSLPRYYAQLGLNDRATTILTRAIQLSLKQTDARSRVTNLGQLLTTASTLKQTAKIAPLLSSIEAAIVPLIRSNQLGQNPTVFQIPIRSILAQSYIETQQPAKALKILDQIARFSPPSAGNPVLARLYFQVNRPDKANPYLNGLLKQPELLIEDSSDARLAAVLDTLKHPQAQTLLNKAWQLANRSLFYTQEDYIQDYLNAGGNPDRVLPAIRPSSPETKLYYFLPLAGTYRQRNQPQKATQTVEQFIRTAQQNQVNGTQAIAFAIEAGYLPEASTAFRRLLRLNLIAIDSTDTINLAQATDSLETIEPIALKQTDLTLRPLLLQQLAIAYTQQGKPDRALSIAEQLPLQESNRSPRIETLTQIAVILHQLGQSAAAQKVFATATQLAQGLSNLPARSTAFAEIAIAYTKIGQTGAAETARQTAIKSAKAIPTSSDFSTVQILTTVSEQFRIQNQIEAAWKTLQEVPKDGRKQINLDSLVLSAIELGQLQIAQQATNQTNLDRGYEAFSQSAIPLAQAYLRRSRSIEAIALLDQIAKRWTASTALEEIAPAIRLYAQLGRIDSARRLLAPYSTAKEPNVVARQQALQQYINCYAQRDRVK